MSSKMQYNEYLDNLADRGAQEIGKGLYAKVFSVPGNPDIAVKVASLDEWPHYIKWATENGYAGTFAPKVFSLKYYDGFYVAIMERLVETIAKFGRDNYHTKISSNNAQITLARRITDWLWNRAPKKDDPEDFRAFFNHMKEAGFTGDLHDGNIMVRKDGQVVITDPSARTSQDTVRIKHGALV